MIVALWTLAMLSALSSPWWATGVCTSLTLLVFIWTQATMLTTWVGWAQLVTLGATPWLLDAQQRRDQALLASSQAEEARRLARLSEAARALLSLQTATQQLERQISEMTEVYHITKDASRAAHVDELFATTAELTLRLLDARRLRLIACVKEPATIWHAGRSSDGRFLPEGAREPDESDRALLEQARGAASGGRAPDAPVQTGRVTWAPIRRDQELLGVLAAEELSAPRAATLGLVAHQLALQLSRISLYEEVEALAVTDALTGLFVRSYFLQRAEEELRRSRRHGLACTLLMMDLDRFKQKNDTYGHLVGDVVLKDVSALLQRNLREIDLLARFGGEEFIMLLTETDVEQALPIAQRLRQIVEVHPIRAYDELLTQTISIGLAGFPQDAQALPQLIDRADQALYAAKRAGRNRVARWAPDLSGERTPG